jgi:hypothetical protein
MSFDPDPALLEKKVGPRIGERDVTLVYAAQT